jgi:hypothetical protein
MVTWIVVGLVFAVVLFLFWRALVRGEVRSFLLRRELELYRRVVYAKDFAAWRDESGDKEGAAEWRELERCGTGALAAFQPVRER